MLTSTKILPPTPAMASTAARRPSISTRVSRSRRRAWDPPPVFWLVLLALLDPVFPRPSKAGRDFRSTSRAVASTPAWEIFFRALTVLTGTATASGVVGRAEPVTTISWPADGSGRLCSLGQGVSALQAEADGRGQKHNSRNLVRRSECMSTPPFKSALIWFDGRRHFLVRPSHHDACGWPCPYVAGSYRPA